MSHLNPYYKGVALALLSALGFSLLPIFGIFAYREGVNVNTLLFLRFTLTALFLFAYAGARKQAFTVSRRQLALLFALGGICYSAQSSLFFSSLHYIPASLTSLLLYTHPLFVAILASIVDKERLTRSNILAIVLSMTGLVFVLGASPAEVNLIGILMAFGAAVVYSAYLLLGTRLVKQMSPLVTSAFVASFAALSLLVAGIAAGKLSLALSATAWMAVAGIVAFATIMAMLALFRSLELIGPTRTSILSMIEPLLTFSFSALLFGDRLTPLQLAGGAAVLAGAALVIKARAKEKAG
ncbi:DMT family transporter [Anaeroselena agilis]|uniref:DMT family transporter n=1 Tax=Anaeroselena agilis TaxID=3063788 RepID=A0ABU3NTR5_9FIRM|nr:DMT family transporter [Selenomonadales bacterium 4137-cl]